jgi:O-antigen/teichoic acid export membrane protein
VKDSDRDDGFRRMNVREILGLVWSPKNSDGGERNGNASPFSTRKSFRMAACENEGFSGALFALAGDSFQYLIGLAVMGLANMALMPLYTRYLSPSEFGLYALVEILALGLITAASLGSGVSYLKWYAAGEPSQVKQLLGTTLWSNGLAALLMGGGLSAFVDSDSGVRILGAPTRTFVLLLLPLVLLETEQSVFLTHLRACRRPVAFSISSIIRLVAIAVFSVWLLAFLRLGLFGLFLGRVLGDVCGLCALIILSKSEISAANSWRLSLATIRYGMPVVLSSLIMLALDGAGRYFVNRYNTLEQVGQFAVGVKIAGLMRILVVAPFGTAWGGLLFQIEKRADAQFIYSKLTGYILLLAVSVAAILSLLSPLLLRVFATPAYHASLSVIPLLLLVQAMMVVHYPATVGIYLRSVTKWQTVILLIGFAVDLLLNRLLVPARGIVGASLAMLAAWVFMITLMALVSQEYYPLRFEWKPVGIAAAIWLLATVLQQPGTLHLNWRSMLLRVSACCGILLAAGLFVFRDIVRSEADFQLES